MGFTVKLKTAIITMLVTMVGALLLQCSQSAKQGVIKGIILCTNTVVPSLFLFTVLAVFVMNSGIMSAICRAISPISKKIFGLNGEQTTVFLLSFLSGYPVGAKLVEDLYKNCKIGRKKALMMLSFCINPGPAFVITAVGSVILGSKTDGKRLFLSVVLSSVTLAFVMGLFMRKCDPEVEKTGTKRMKNLADCFVGSVFESAVTMFNISAFVVVFSGFAGVISGINIGNDVKQILLSLGEVTVATSNLARNQLPLVAFVVGFGGVSVILQVKSVTKELNPKITVLFLYRIAVGFLSLGYIKLFEALVPRSRETAVLFENGNLSYETAVEPFGIVALLLMAVTLVVSVGRRQKVQQTLEIE